MAMSQNVKFQVVPLNSHRDTTEGSEVMPTNSLVENDPNYSPDVTGYRSSIIASISDIKKEIHDEAEEIAAHDLANESDSFFSADEEELLENNRDPFTCQNEYDSLGQAKKGRLPPKREQTRSIDEFRAFSNADGAASNSSRLRYQSKHDAAKCVIFPDDPPKVSWDMLIGLLLVYTATVTPYRVCFIEDEDWDFWFIFELCIDAVFFMDVVINFFSAYYDKTDNLVIDNKKIVKNYLSGWFIFDLSACVPINLLLRSGSSDYNKFIRIARIPRLYRLVKMTKLLRIAKVIKERNKFAKYLNEVFHMRAGLERLLYFCLTFVLAIHIYTCIWYLLTKLVGNDDNVNWVTAAGLQDEDNFDLYIAGFYWTLQTITTVGYGDIHAVNTEERIMACVWMCLGVFSYSFTIGTLTSILGSMDQKAAKYNQTTEVLKNVTREYGIDKSLYDRLREALKYDYRKNQDDKQYLLSELPQNLRIELSLIMHQDTIRNIPFFRNKPPHFIAFIGPLLRPTKARANEYIYVEGDHVDEMYFLKDGEVAAILRETNLPYTKVKKGYFFGEVDVLFSLKRTETVAALSDCDMLSLSKNDFFRVIEEFPYIRKEILMTAVKRRKRMNNRKEAAENFVRKNEDTKFRTAVTVPVDDPALNQEDFMRKQGSFFMRTLYNEKRKKDANITEVSERSDSSEEDDEAGTREATAAVTREESFDEKSVESSLKVPSSFLSEGSGRVPSATKWGDVRTLAGAIGTTRKAGKSSNPISKFLSPRSGQAMNDTMMMDLKDRMNVLELAIANLTELMVNKDARKEARLVSQASRDSHQSGTPSPSLQSSMKKASFAPTLRMSHSDTPNKRSSKKKSSSKMFKRGDSGTSRDSLVSEGMETFRTDYKHRDTAASTLELVDMGSRELSKKSSFNADNDFAVGKDFEQDVVVEDGSNLLLFQSAGAQALTRIPSEHSAEEDFRQDSRKKKELMGVSSLIYHDEGDAVKYDSQEEKHSYDEEEDEEEDPEERRQSNESRPEKHEQKLQSVGSEVFSDAKMTEDSKAITNTEASSRGLSSGQRRPFLDLDDHDGRNGNTAHLNGDNYNQGDGSAVRIDVRQAMESIHPGNIGSFNDATASPSADYTVTTTKSGDPQVQVFNFNESEYMNDSVKDGGQLSTLADSKTGQSNAALPEISPNRGHQRVNSVFSERATLLERTEVDSDEEEF